MSSLFRSMRSSLGGRDLALKNNLVAKLSICVKDLQVEQADPDSKNENTVEAISSLCTALEAIFIHGLKESFIQRLMSEVDVRPDPNFWGPLLEMSHRDVTKLNLIQTDVGRCRAWLRLALNDGVLTRYLEAMRTEGQRALSHYYRKGALLRDVELLDVVQRLLEGIESYPFNLPLNSSLLDKWTLQPLLQAGLWTPPIKSVPKETVPVATEAAELGTEEQEADTISVASYQSIGAAISPMFPFNEEEALKIILGTPVNESPLSARVRAEETSTDQRESRRPTVQENKECGNMPILVEKIDESQTEKASQIAESRETEDDDNSSAMGNSLIGRLGWSSSFDESTADSSTKQRDDETETILKERAKKDVTTRPGYHSYHSLLESYNPASTAGSSPPDFNDFLQKFEPNINSSPSGSFSEKVDLDEAAQELGFEIVNDSLSTKFKYSVLFDVTISNLINFYLLIFLSDFGKLLLNIVKLPQDFGLDAQKYTCYECGQPIGFNFGEARLCGLTGRYFCDQCTVNPGYEWVVPARILLNWDYRRYCVSKKAAEFLSEVQHHPILDFKSLNPYLYLTVQEVAELQKLRNKLNLLRAYLFTCREPIIEELQKMVWPRDYLYEHVHLYSISDLLQIPNGVLAQLLKQVVTFARNHVLSCWLCSQKGFICEVCNNPKIIYPFDTENTFRCSGCNAVFHADCLNAKMPCRKCERRKLRATSIPSESETIVVG
ncbi:Pleckstrin homology domain-containing family M member 3 [Frankliniella fusca]|uniref:Pleckstrin homology domain-containing family M member 3 n=1 Tax=Frankliniella fusca TaxID=407009 RepID=A0AAE1LW23_9NEOP|nr:Pleckstrin homology domain-containing family M member 3 [Frankliniella fusca]